MKPAYAAGSIPTSGLEWRQWCRAMIETLGLCAGEANVLRLLTDRAGASGTVRLGVPLIARQLVLSESQVYRWLGRLGERGLLRTRQQGRGRIAVRELVAVPEPTQLSLFDAPVHSAPAAAATVVSAPQSPWAAVAPADPCPRMDASLPSHQRDPAVEGQRNDRQQQGTHAHDRASSGPLSPSLPVVLEILAQAPELIVEDATVDIALRAFPSADHLRAAQRVVLLALEPGLRDKSASRQLWKALERQSAPGLGAAPHNGRRRSAPPQPSSRPLTADGRRWGPVSDNPYDRAAGLT